ncbi:MAG TPA: DUF4388 domain-containing protein [Ktedonobacteraceae bacterium]|nr:DUF4388 domain-containing protein [Ktedonobacteraceae bacterium]
MTKGRENAAENLSDVIELIRKRRQSGLLSIESIQGGLFEEGEIFFQGGQPIYARQGQATSADAFTRLLSWEQVYFAFFTNQPQPSANIPSAIRTRANVAIATDPLAQSVNPARSNANDTGPFGSRSQAVIPDRNSSSDFPLIGNTPGLEWLVPQKLGNDRNVLSLPLTRPQRSIYLLIDGKRTVSDLARCTRKNLQEIERLLSELQERGLISI